MKTVKATTRYGEMFVPVTDAYVGRSLVEYGEWAQSEIHILEQVIQPGLTVLDVGANLGYHTLALSKAVGPTGSVISFEPQPAIFQLLAANIAINNLSNVIALNMALGEKRGYVDLPPLPYDQPGNFGAFRLHPFLKDDETASSYIAVPIQRLDDIAIARNTSVIKMDVEEMELFVLTGARELICRNKPIMLVENNNHGEGSENILKFLDEMGYESYWQISFSFGSKNYNGNTVNIFGRQSSINVIATPREANIQVNGLRKIADTSDHPQKWSLQQSG